MLEESLRKIDLSATPPEDKQKLPSTPPSGQESSRSSNPAMKIIAYLLVVAIGIGTGYFAHNQVAGSSGTTGGAGGSVNPQVDSSGLKVGETYGAPETIKFKDTAVGVLDRGGINGEGSHKLLREGGKSQTVYLTSSVIDLDQFVGTKVTVWGDTFSAQKAGWLMDVGRVKVEQLNAPIPSYVQ